ncbi:MAG TPA: iron ABC transporter permease [Prolixibacteraceae bacterium]|nr:iron ABC transporter permease [Prolixibacteraceae bacterium]
MPEKIIAQYKLFLKRRFWFVVAALLLMIGLSVYALVSGSSEIGLKDLLGLMGGKSNEFASRIIFSIRMPRVIGAILGGTALAVSGAVTQSLLRNPLASPFTLGISGASAFGAAFAIIVLGAGSTYTGSNDLSHITNPYLVTISAFTWSLLSVFVILALSRMKGSSPEIIILSGIIISSLFGAGISALQYFADTIQLASIVFWTFGDMGRATWSQVLVLLIVLLPVLLYFFYQNWNYKSLHSGDEYALSLGVKVNRVRLGGMVAASLATAVVVSFFGVIAFIGLVVPHIVRRVVKGDEHFVIPASALFGGIFLLLSDTLARTIIAPVVLPVGILTSFIGAPMFLFLLIKGMKK